MGFTTRDWETVESGALFPRRRPLLTDLKQHNDLQVANSVHVEYSSGERESQWQQRLTYGQ